MAIQAIQFFDNFQLKLWNKEIDLDTDVLKCILLSSVFVPNAATQVNLADIVANEIVGSGYARQTLGTPTLVLDAGVPKFDCDDIVYTAAGGTITARYYAIYDDTHLSDALIGYGLLDTTPADVSVVAPNTLTIQPNATGLFRGAV